MLLHNAEIRYFTIADVTILIFSFIFCILTNINILPILFIQWFVINIAIFTLLHYRYHKLSRLSLEIDKILHSGDTHEIEYLKEGELNILGSEINKMLIRISEQNKELAKDKVYLVNSLADLSHQIKTPLTSLLLTNTMLIEENNDDCVAKHLIVQKKMLNRIQWLIDSLLKISRLDANVVTFVYHAHRFSEILDNAIEPVSIILDVKNQNLSTELTEDMIINCDINWLSEAISNILKNCIEHTPENGFIKITGIDNTLFSKIIIEDNGPGFTTHDIPHLFDRFYKGSHSSIDSAGIGLALAKAIIIRHNGIIKAYNKPSGGACFEIKIYKSTI